MAHLSHRQLCVCESVCAWERERETERERALRNSLAYFVSRVSMTAQWHKEQIIILAVKATKWLTTWGERWEKMPACFFAAHLLRTACLLFKVYITLAETHSPAARRRINALNTCQVKHFDENLFHQPPSDPAALSNGRVAFICKDTKQEGVWYKISDRHLCPAYHWGISLSSTIKKN